MSRARVAGSKRAAPMMIEAHRPRRSGSRRGLVNRPWWSYEQGKNSRRNSWPSLTDTPSAAAAFATPP
jgi:hypothetical protein